VLFVTYLWGKPQLRRRRRMRSPALGRGMDKSLKRPVRLRRARLGTKEKSHDPQKCKQYIALLSNSHMRVFIDKAGKFCYRPKGLSFFGKMRGIIYGILRR